MSLAVMTCKRWPAFIGRFSLHSISNFGPMLPRRDGQKRPVFIYRLVTTGAIDGKRTNLLKSQFDKLLSRKNIPKTDLKDRAK